MAEQFTRGKTYRTLDEQMVRSGIVFDIIGIVLVVAGIIVMAQLVGLV